MSLSKARNITPTPAQLRVLRLIAQGYSDPEIAVVLHITHNTAKTHSHSILHRLDARTRAHAVAIGFRKGYLA